MSRTQSLILAPQSEAAYEGALVLESGGNSADALVTASFVQGAVDPHRCGIGGFGCATLSWNGGREVLCVDFHGRAGHRASPNHFESRFESAAPDGFGYVVRGKVNDVGYQSVTVPGMVAGVAEIHRRYGKLPWRDLVMRAADTARRGFLVTPPLADFWRRPGLHGRVSTYDRLALTEDGRRINLKTDGQPYDAGDVFQQPQLAETYRQIAEKGPESFYRGALAEKIANDWKKNDALVTKQDLQDYAPEIQPPLVGTYRGFKIQTTPLPGGGAALLQALSLLEKHDLRRVGHNTVEYLELVGPILQMVWRDRLTQHGDPRFGGKNVEELLSPEHLARLTTGPISDVDSDSASTTQLTIVDRELNAISFSHSLGYGSGVFPPGCGFMLNNCMSAFDPRPGRRNSIAPGKARSTAVAETIVSHDGRPILVLGSPGAARITAALVQTIVNVLDFDMDVAEAVVHPRFDAYGDHDIVLESRFPLPIVRNLEGKGWNVVHSPKPFGVIGRVYAVQLAHDYRLTAGVDPGEPGAAYRLGC